MKLIRLPLLVLSVYSLVLMGCGQKGPLYLPEKQTPPILKEDNVKTTEPTLKAEPTAPKEQAIDQNSNEAPL